MNTWSKHVEHKTLAAGLSIRSAVGQFGQQWVEGQGRSGAGGTSPQQEIYTASIAPLSCTFPKASRNESFI